MKRLFPICFLLSAFCFSLLASTNVPPALVVIPWVVDPLNSTNYTRTNLPAWWDSTNNYSAGVRLWQMSQAINENYTRLTNAMARIQTNAWLYQAAQVPTNLIPVSPVGITNWLLCNITNLGPILVATNTADGGFQKITLPAPSAL